MGIASNYRENLSSIKKEKERIHHLLNQNQVTLTKAVA